MILSYIYFTFRAYNLAMNQERVAAHHEDEVNPSFDIMIVFGEGPIKDIFYDDELDNSQQEEWSRFTQDPRHTIEPNFRVVTGRREDRFKYWHTGRIASKRMGRFNALAAGHALLNGLTRSVILTGGKAQDEQIDREELSMQEERPSEAELMKDIIKKRFGKLYQDKYGKPIDNVILMEDQASDTIENIKLSIAKYPYLREGKTKIGLLTANHHTQRARIISNMFGLNISEASAYSSQMLLTQRAVFRGKSQYVSILGAMMDKTNPAIKPMIREQVEGFKKLDKLGARDI